MRSGPRYFANGLFPDFTLLVTDTLGQPQSRIVADPPFTPRDAPDMNGRRLLNRNFMAANPGDGRFVLAYQFRSRLDFFTPDGERYGRISGPRATRPSFGMRNGRFAWNDDNEMAFQGVAASRNYVYALFCGCSIEEQRTSSVVQVFRWNGDFVAELQLDRPVLEIAVDEDRTLYGAAEEPYPGVAEWALPPLGGTATVARL